MSRPAACILLAFMVLCSLRTQPGPSITPVVQAAETVPQARATVRSGGPLRIDFPAIALREAKAAGIRDPELFVRQIAAESGFLPCAGSGAGAIGIAQIMPGTAKGWNVDPWMPVEALRAAAKAMAKYEKSYGSYSIALQAYNAGPGAVQKYKGKVPYGETREYVRRIMGDYPLTGLNSVYVRPSGYTPEFSKSLRGLIRAVRARGGKVEVVPGNGFRSVKDQTRLWRDAKRKHGSGASRWVAPPWCSNHSRGLSADLRGDLELAARLAPRYGIYRPMNHEPWHFELHGS